ncbi:MAG: peptidoglycan DD-metalloendopeptidase family protein [Acidiferrobacterales bacterium]|nr:peptidoglycan DD-metalloendopeptidase family protein [Acidiferrobacterales bacterium]
MKYIGFVFLFILLTGCATRKYPAPIVAIDQSQSPYSQSHRNSLDTDFYTVKTGETLYSIAWRAGLDFRLLAQINGIKAPYAIFPGQKLVLDKKLAKIKQEQSNFKNKTRPVSKINTNKKINKKTVANKKAEEYGKKQADQKTKKSITQSVKKAVKNDSFPSKVRTWRYPSNGKIIDTYSTKENGNKGIDFGGQIGDPVIAAADGKVVYAGSALRGFGNLIIIKHNNDYLSAYAHNRVLKVKEQDWVEAGQLIAEMGDSGTDKVKLHFEIRFRGRTVNPLKYLPRKR